MTIIIEGKTAPQVKGYYSVKREDSRKCCGCEVDYENCQKVKCCKFQGIWTDIKFIKEEHLDLKKCCRITVVQLRKGQHEN